MLDFAHLQRFETPACRICLQISHGELERRTCKGRLRREACCPNSMYLPQRHLLGLRPGPVFCNFRTPVQPPLRGAVKYAGFAPAGSNFTDVVGVGGCSVYTSCACFCAPLGCAPTYTLVVLFHGGADRTHRLLSPAGFLVFTFF